MYIYHISDIHYQPSDVEGANKLKHIISAINGNATRPDLVVITGDLVWKEHQEYYAGCFDILSTLSAPYVVISGNHDRSSDLISALRQYVPSHPQPAYNLAKLNYVEDNFPVRIIGLDSFKHNVGGGELTAKDFAWLRHALEDNSECKPVVILVHQYTLPTGSGFFDAHQASWYKEFNQIVSEHADTVKLVLCGHLHNSVSSLIGGIVPIISGFSTNWGEDVLEPNKTEPNRDTLRPLAYLIHRIEGGKVSSYTVTVR